MRIKTEVKERRRECESETEVKDRGGENVRVRQK